MRGQNNELNLDVYSRFDLNGTEAIQVCCTKCASVFVLFILFRFSEVICLRITQRYKCLKMQISG